MILSSLVGQTQGILRGKHGEDREGAEMRQSSSNGKSATLWITRDSTSTGKC